MRLDSLLLLLIIKLSNYLRRIHSECVLILTRYRDNFKAFRWCWLNVGGGVFIRQTVVQGVQQTQTAARPTPHTLADPHHTPRLGRPQQFFASLHYSFITGGDFLQPLALFFYAIELQGVGKFYGVCCKLLKGFRHVSFPSTTYLSKCVFETDQVLRVLVVGKLKN